MEARRVVGEIPAKFRTSLSSIRIEPGIWQVQTDYNPADNDQDDRNQDQLNPAEVGNTLENWSPVDLVVEPSF